MAPVQIVATFLAAHLHSDQPEQSREADVLLGHCKTTGSFLAPYTEALGAVPTLSCW